MLYGPVTVHPKYMWLFRIPPVRQLSFIRMAVCTSTIHVLILSPTTDWVEMILCKQTVVFISHCMQAFFMDHLDEVLMSINPLFNIFRRFAKMWYKGIGFSHEHSALTYLVDAAGARTTMDTFVQPQAYEQLMTGVFFE